MDTTSETIARFIGYFDQMVEAARMRFEYNDLAGLIPEDPRLNPLDPLNRPFDTDYLQRDYNPKLPYELSKDGASVGPVIVPSLPLSPPQISYNATNVSPGVAPPVFPTGGSGTAVVGEDTFNLNFELPAPNSIFGVTIQTIDLSDNDSLRMDGDYHFADAPDFAAALTRLENEADDLQQISIPFAAVLEDPGIESAMLIVDAVDKVEDGEHVTVILKGDDATGLIVNGEEADEVPLYQDNLPERLKPEDAQETSENEGEEQDFDPLLTGEPREENEFAVDPGHDISTGENVSTNQTFISTSMVDAPVIAVTGDVVKLDAISQVNVVSDQDYGVGATESTSKTINAASIETVSSEDTSEETAATQEEAEAENLPVHWETVRIEGDLVVVNSVQQHTYTQDFDQSQVTITAAATEVVTGSNTTSNFVTLSELGFYYDLIIVGGDMIDVTVVTQVNVLLDDDVVTVGNEEVGSAETEYSFTVEDEVATSHPDGELELVSYDIDTAGEREAVASEINESALTEEDVTATVQQAEAASGTDVETTTVDSGDTTLVADEEATTEDIIVASVEDNNPSEEVATALGIEAAIETHPSAGEPTVLDETETSGASGVSRSSNTASEADFASHEEQDVIETERSVALEEDVRSSDEEYATSSDELDHEPSDERHEVVAADVDEVTVESGVNEGVDVEPAAAVHVSQSDNLLLNQASIYTQGTDTFVESNDTFVAEAEALADGASNISSDVAQDDLFAGNDVLRVLYIEEDLVEFNLVEQVNVVGDSDLVHLALNERLAEVDARINEANEAIDDANAAIDVAITTGSNALLNAAVVADYGLDSTVLTNGEVYSDALIYQAELVDFDAVDQDLSALANEAVAFLAPDMIDAEDSAPEFVPTSQNDLPGTADVMQTVLA